MEVILLQRIAKLGQMGDTVRVKDGFARNFLLPSGRALRATETNKKRFEKDRAQLEARNLDAKNEASAVAEKLTGSSFIVIRSAGETGQLYGSVSTRDIADTLTEGGFSVVRQQVRLDRPIKTIGLMEILITLHPEVEVPITLNVARSSDEAERQTRGEDLTQRDAFAIEEEEEAAPDLEEVFENPEDIELEAVDEAGEEPAEAEAEESSAEPEDAGSDEEDETKS
jgi:large subunit ribosomal protein L9